MLRPALLKLSPADAPHSFDQILDELLANAARNLAALSLLVKYRKRALDGGPGDDYKPARRKISYLAYKPVHLVLALFEVALKQLSLLLQPLRALHLAEPLINIVYLPAR